VVVAQVVGEQDDRDQCDTDDDASDPDDRGPTRI
jgi:hypothetical protein